ncbi:MAG TPA: 4'-phosphopantetheinyl transferase superfamily protein [Gammaproteobacteria bacterium]|nr:4'-phosphopantetheinyl transferase superfamily protein [Gammaproteobacteria bacterium]
MMQAAHEVHCYTTTLTPTPEALAHAKSLLSPDEQKRASQFHFEHHRTHFIAARGFLRLTLGFILNQDPKNLVFTYGKHQKPALKNEALQFNLAHSGELAVLATHPIHPLGIDIEQVQTQNKRDIAERFFSAEENAFLNRCSDQEQNDAFFALWARKEAVVKAIGTGLQQSLSSFTVPLTAHNALIIVDEKPWRVWPLAIHPNYASALATHPDIKNISFWQWLEGQRVPDEQKKYF